jgi:tubulin polyglutamylase TTLL4
MKPVASAQGKGIKLINKKDKIKKNKNYLISEYIKNPHLINQLKYDLRVYVLVTSYDPLKIYVFREGLCRFATEKYDNNKIKQRYSHLTNYSVNKNNSKFIKTKNLDEDGIGSKWSFKALRLHY